MPYSLLHKLARPHAMRNHIPARGRNHPKHARMLQNYDFTINVGTSLCDVNRGLNSYVNVPKARPYILAVMQSPPPAKLREENYFL